MPRIKHLGLLPFRPALGSLPTPAGAVGFRDVAARWWLPKLLTATIDFTGLFDTAPEGEVEVTLTRQKVGGGNVADEHDLIEPLLANDNPTAIYLGSFNETWNGAGGNVNGTAKVVLFAHGDYDDNYDATGTPATLATRHYEDTPPKMTVGVHFEAEMNITSPDTEAALWFSTATYNGTGAGFVGTIDSGSRTPPVMVWNPPAGLVANDRETEQDIGLNWTCDNDPVDPDGFGMRVEELEWFEHDGFWTGTPGEVRSAEVP